MTIETMTANEQAVESPAMALTSQPTSLIKTTLWLLALLLLPQLFFGFAAGVYYGAIHGENFSQADFELWFNSSSILLAIAALSPIISLPLLIKASIGNNWQQRFSFWALVAVNRQQSFKWLSVGASFWGLTVLLATWLAIPAEPFMLGMKTDVESFFSFALTISTVCVIVPIMEELIFRGWLFTRLAATKLSSTGALIITTLVFTLIHAQYEQPMTFGVIFCLGLLLGYVRFKSQNISYCIMVHMLFNSLAMAALFLL
jgi:membrane protease YdiL (CAAX protease family)